MVLRMKSFSIFGIDWKIQFLGGEYHKNQYIGGIA